MLQSRATHKLTRRLGGATIMFGLLAAVLIAYVGAERSAQSVVDHRARTLQLIEEMRQSSDSLTQMARGYVMTGDGTYKQRYDDIQSVREGRKPRPRGDTVYWDRVLYGESLPQGASGEVESLAERARRLATGAEEVALAQAALRNIDALETAEFNAMGLREGAGGPRGLADLDRAKTLLFSDAYFGAKLNLLRSIGALNRLIDARTAAAVAQENAHAAILRNVSIGAGLAGLFLLWTGYVSVRRLLGASPARLFTQIERLGKGDFTPTDDPRRPGADSVMSWLSATREELRARTLARERAENELETRNTYLWVSNRTLQKVMENAPLAETLDELMRIIEKSHPGIIATVLLANRRRTHLRTVAAPSLPADWIEATAQIPIAARGGGSSGTAAFLGRRVIVEDNRTNPCWATFLEAAQNAGIRSGWSQPFKDSQGGVLGAFAIYHREPAVPSEKEIQLIEDYANLVRLAVERTRLAEQLRESQRMYRLLAENSNDVVWLMEVPSLSFSYISPSIRLQNGWTPDEIIGRSLGALHPCETEATIRHVLANCMSSANRSDYRETFEVELRHKDGHLVPVEMAATILLDDDGHPCQIVGTSRDISQRKAGEEAVRRLAFFDRLTDLPNRRLLEDRLQQAIARAQRERSGLSVLFIDLDKFKPINDEFGHEAGDWLLQHVAHRMLGCLRQSDTVARIGGDEFIVLLPDAYDVFTATGVAEKIRATLETPFVMNEQCRLQISSSIGVVLYPHHADNARDLLRFGDEAMYRAKRAGRNMVRVFGVQPGIATTAGNSPGLIHLGWDQADICGEPTIDAEHQELLLGANRLLDLAARACSQPDEIRLAFDALLSQVTAHFAHEEQILAAYRFEGLNEHCMQHRTLVAQARRLQRAHGTSAPPLGELVEFIVFKMVSEHLRTADAQFFHLFQGASTGPHAYAVPTRDAVS
jgi:diguanylate cyclase (GGDEF)-like protein/hemerythrin-like metal-binding protein/PAS domain S-box-containing protein